MIFSLVFEQLRLKFYIRKTSSVRRANTFQYIYATYNQHKTEREREKVLYTAAELRLHTLITNPYVNEVTLRRQKPPLKYC